MADADKPKEPRSKLYPLILTLILILGAVGFIMFLAWLSKGPRVRIPFFLIAIPIVILIGIAQLLDDLVLKIAPRMVRNRDRALLAHKLGRDPVTGLPPDLLRLAPGQAAVPQQPWGAAPPAQPVGVQAAAGGGRTPTGYTNLYGQAPHAPYGQAPTSATGYTNLYGQAPHAPYGQAPTSATGYTNPYGQTPHAPYGQAPTSATGYTNPYGQAPHAPYGQAPTSATGYTNPYGQTPHAPYGQIPTGYTPPDGRAQSEYGRTPTDPQPSAQQNAPRGRRPPACDDDSSSA